MKISEVKNNAFYQMPQWLYEEPYNALSDKAKQIYMFLFDRRTLSIQNKWFDDKGDVFVYFTNEQLMEKLNCSKPTIISAKKELADMGLLREFRQGVNKPNRLYISGSKKTLLQEVKNIDHGSKKTLLQEVKNIDTIKTDNIKTEYNHTDIINYKEDGKKSFSKIIKDSNIKINERHTQMLMDYIALDHFTIPMIQYAVEKTEDAGSTSFNYLKAILENWKKEGFTSLEQVEDHDRKRQAKQTKKEASPYPIKNPVFSPYTDLLPWEEDEEG